MKYVHEINSVRKIIFYSQLVNMLQHSSGIKKERQTETQNKVKTIKKQYLQPEKRCEFLKETRRKFIAWFPIYGSVIVRVVLSVFRDGVLNSKQCC